MKLYFYFKFGTTVNKQTCFSEVIEIKKILNDKKKKNYILETVETFVDLINSFFSISLSEAEAGKNNKNVH